MYINFAAVGYGDVQMLARVSVYDIFSQKSCMIFGHVVMESYPDYAYHFRASWHGRLT